MDRPLSQVDVVLKDIKDGKYSFHYINLYGKETRFDHKAARKDLYAAYISDIKNGCCHRLKNLTEAILRTPKRANSNSVQCVLETAEYEALCAVYNYFRYLDRSPSYSGTLTLEKLLELYDVSQGNNAAVGDSEKNDIEVPDKEEKTEETDPVGNTGFRVITPSESEKTEVDEIEKDEIERPNEEDEKRRIKALKKEYEEKLRELDRKIADAQKTQEEELLRCKEMAEDYLNQKRKEADEKIDEYRKITCEAVKKEAEDRFEQIVKERLNDYLIEKDIAWKNGYREFDSIRTEVSRSIGCAKLECCDEASRIQREMVDMMNGYMEKLGAGLDKWRDSLYSLQLEEFARWISKFYGFVDRIDRRISNNYENRETVAEITRMSKTLMSLRNQLDRVLPQMGLRCFYPVAGDSYDPVYHEVDSEHGIEIGREIIACKNPGVEMGLANQENARILSKAEVQVKECNDDKI